MFKGKKKSEMLYKDSKSVPSILIPDDVQLERTLGLVGVVGERPHVNDLMPDIVKCIEKEESKRNIVLASKWYGNDDDDDYDYSPSMLDYLYDDDYDFSSMLHSSSKRLKKLQKKHYSKRKGKNARMSYGGYDDGDDYWNNRESLYGEKFDDASLDEYDGHGYKSIKFYPDIRDEGKYQEFYSLKEFEIFCSQEGYTVGDVDLENLRTWSIIHCCLDPIDKEYGENCIITDNSYGGLYWTVSDDLPIDNGEK